MMKIKWTAALLVALLLSSSTIRAQAGKISAETPAVVQLTHALDAKTLTLGANIPTRLTAAVHFANGTKLPSGTWLNATVVEDDMQIAGKVKLALRFTEARMKGGKTIPIKATILAVATRAEPVENDPDTMETVMPVPANLNNQPDIVDVLGVVPGVDLHSRAGSQNSGIFVTATEDNIKLPIGAKLELALAPST